jgi:hypothetical protein
MIKLELGRNRLRTRSMPTLSLCVPHRLSQTEAFQRIRSRVDLLVAEYQSYIARRQIEWRPESHEVRFSGSAAGLELSGLLTVRPAEVELHLKLPLAAWLFKSKVEQVIRQHLEAALSQEAG